VRTKVLHPTFLRAARDCLKHHVRMQVVTGLSDARLGRGAGEGARPATASPEPALKAFERGTAHVHNPLLAELGGRDGQFPVFRSRSLMVSIATSKQRSPVAYNVATIAASRFPAAVDSLSE
jgi:hypothetical protein